MRVENGEKDQKIIRNTIALLDKIGPAYWCGYSYAWLGNMKARAKDGAGASKALKDFATAFCSVNSFHLNGDQTRSGKSQFTYRPFTLEGNFAFASGIQEMLLQSYTGNIEIFPAIPSEWKELSFENLRAEGAFLVSAKRSGGLTDEVKIVSEKGGMVLLKSPFKTYFVRSLKSVKWKYLETGFFELRMEKGGQIVLKNGYE
ncbi:glycoside hydrolase family 95-like protein [Pseudarcicella hirudinis]|uniref:glycoside hydrolase family 95-like protein n=1 Tax=Pseudarcicella hirudinis TaxID=1079859 RepID=UPI0035F0AA8F